MMTRNYWIMPLLAALVFVGACQTGPEPEPTYEDAAMYQFTTTNYQAADRLLAGYGMASVNNFSSSGGGAILVATLADVSRLESSSPFGRIISEQLVSRIAQSGRSVVEIKLRDNVFIQNNNGEFMITRKVSELAIQQNAGAVLVGTYAKSERFVFVSLKLINPANSLVLSSYDYTLPIDKVVRRLLTETSQRSLDKRSAVRGSYLTMRSIAD
jgi:TolB-like protein